MSRYYEMFRRNFPFIVRDEREALEIINNPENRIIEVNNDSGKLIGVSIIHKNTILMLCVDEEYRNKGIGNKLLSDSEKYIIGKGYDKVSIGAGDNYLMPGIPMATKPYNEQLKEDKIYADVSNDFYNFFQKEDILIRGKALIVLT